MTPAARAQAAIELLDQIIAAARDGGAAGDTLVQRYFAQRRYAGSKDRRAVRELVYAAIRRAGEMPRSGRAALVAVADDDPALAATFDGSPHGPLPIEEGEPRAAAGTAPAWLVEALRRSGLDQPACEALVGRAPLDVRVNELRADRDALVAQIVGAEPTPHSPLGLRLPAGTQVEALAPFRDGAIEVQDEGSQLVSLATGAAPDMQVVDLCAGAGGKTLALGGGMANRGAILACDVDRARLSKLVPRAARAGLAIAETRLLDPGREVTALADWRHKADLVVVDAPCSGSGTWRRNPEARWRLSQARLDRLVASQRHILTIAGDLVRPGGTLAYIVCSLLDEEGAGQVDRWLAEHPGWQAHLPSFDTGVRRGAGWRLDPASSGTDGFFLARLIAPC